MPFKRISRKRKIVRHGSRAIVAKRRRMAVSRFRRRGRSVTTQTSRQEFGSNPFRFRGRKLRKSVYRRALYNSTRFKTHYRTVLATTDSLGTPNNVTTLNPYIVPALSTINLSEFWHSAGGLQDPSFGEVPSFAGATNANDPISVILRGGRLWITTSLSLGSVDTCKVRLQLIFPKQQVRNESDTNTSNTLGVPGSANGWIGTTGINLFGPGVGGGTARPIGWDLTQAPDYQQYFYAPVVDKSFDLKAGDSMTTFFKIKPVKIDVASFKDGQGYTPYWVVYAGQDNNSNGASETFVVTIGHNMSFAVGDTLT